MAEERQEKPQINFPHGRAFRDPDDQIHVIVPPETRTEKTGQFDPERDLLTHPYDHPREAKQARKNRPEIAELAKAKLAEFKKGDASAIGTGVEIEGVLYDQDGKILKVHQEPMVTFSDAPPELYDGQLEIVTKEIGKREDKKIYPSSAIQVAGAVSDAVARGIHIAHLRNGQLVFSSVPEGGKPDQLRVTEHEKILSGMDRAGIYPQAPAQVKEIAKRIGIDKILPFHGTHVHTSNPELPSGLFDTKAAYAAGIIGLTQMAQVESYMLFNTKHLLGIRLDETRDVRSIMKRASIGAQDTTIPDNAHAMADEGIAAVEEGATHQISRYPAEGQYDRKRFFKEFGTTESVVGSANPDLRIILAHIYFEQLMRVLSYKALAATGGDESQVLSYLQNDYEDGKYGYLFEKLSTMEGENSNFQQDLRFNKDGFHAKGNNNKTYREQMEVMRQIVRNLGAELSAFRTQAKIVDHVFGKMIEPPQEDATVEDYMDPDSEMKGGILTDYKSDNIEENIKMQAEGTKKQQEKLQQVHTETDLLKFFGINPNKEEASIR